MTLEETIQQYKNDSGFTSADIMFNASLTDNDWKEIARRYAKGKLEEAADEARLELVDTYSGKTRILKKYQLNYRDKIRINKESITNINLD